MTHIRWCPECIDLYGDRDMCAHVRRCHPELTGYYCDDDADLAKDRP